MFKFCFTIFLLIFISSLSFSQTQSIQFEHITTKDGLSNSSVICILQDRQGFMWFGTEEGVSRFDGYNFTNYKYSPDDTNCISANYIWSLFEDSEGFIWIGTGNGLNKFDPVTEIFSHYFHDEKQVESISDNDVTCILEDSDGYLWIGTSHGLNQYDRKMQKFKHFIHDPNNPNSLSLNYISCLYEDSRGDLWIGTGIITAEVSGGINKLNRKTEQFIRYKFDAGLTGHSNWIMALAEDAAGNIWIGTDAGLKIYNGKSHNFTNNGYNGSLFPDQGLTSIRAVFFDSKRNLWAGSYSSGLASLDKFSTEFILHQNNPQDSYSLSNNKVQSVYEDRNGCLWIGTKGGGVNKINPFSKYFQHYKKYLSPAEMQPALEVNNITAICEDHSGKLWLGSEGGVHTLGRSPFTNNWNTILSLQSNQINSIIEDDLGIFWIGTTNGLIKYDPLKKWQKWYTFYEQEPTQKHALYVYALLIDQTGLLWMGTHQGLYRFNRKNETYSRFVHDSEQINTLSDNRVFSLLESSFGTLWVGTVYGLNKFDPVNQTFLNSQVDQKILEHLKYNDIRVMCEDNLNNLWIGTAYGLKMFHLTTENFRLFTQKDGLPDNVINGLLPDNHGNIWISTNSGLSKFNPVKNEFKNYDYWDGIQNTTFNSGACFINKNGEMLFGGNNGLTICYPDSIKEDLSLPPIVFTGFKKFNKVVHLDTAISYLKQLTFAYHENVLSFEFAALNFVNPRKNQFAYKMEGFVDDWIYLGNRHDIDFTNLSPGKYILRVKGSNSADVWNEQGTSIRIIITPPWWRTGWASALYALILSSMVVGLWRFQLRRINIRNELKLRKFEAQKLQEIDTMKSRFFANISHEFRTPLTLILGPISKMLEKTKDPVTKQELTMMQRNAKRLQRLINQLLDLSKIEAGKMTLQTRPENIVTLLNRIVQSFKSQAKLKGIELKFHTKQNEIMAYVDSEKIENIFYNLLSNALKFTSSGGVVECNVQIVRDQSDGSSEIRNPKSEIVIKDTGIGIPVDRLDKIFDRFYQVDDSHTREHEGTGIGLALTKELVELHHGQIKVESELQKGTTFTVYLPLGKAHLKPAEIISEQAVRSIETESAPVDIETPHEVEELDSKTLPHQKTLPVFMIVEDNRDMRAYMHDCLCQNYQLLEAIDGEDGFHQAVNCIPDLIISDVMMPKIDGFELCQQLKSDERTSHIPIILLTARSSIESKIKGLEFGADDYLIKPFDTSELRVRVKNLIEQRRKLREKFSQNIFLKPAEIAVTSYDQRFLQRTIDIIEKHLADPDFDVTLLTHEVGMSRMQLHRKLHALTNQSASQFIRILRLKRAAELLHQHFGNVAEIAYEVGFSNPSYFAECFRRQFGVLPSEYLGGHKF